VINKTDLKELQYDKNWTNMAKQTGQWQAPVNTAFEETGEFLD
jgi:hypothetical protein